MKRTNRRFGRVFISKADELRNEMRSDLVISARNVEYSFADQLFEETGASFKRGYLVYNKKPSQDTTIAIDQKDLSNLSSEFAQIVAVGASNTNHLRSVKKKVDELCVRADAINAQSAELGDKVKSAIGDIKSFLKARP